MISSVDIDLANQTRHTTAALSAVANVSETSHQSGTFEA